ncbi:MAG TPA: NFACT RNA binding domain-containing protein [Anaeromyxobacter sp.]|nr:NFACT RNA binding domain-containing protein [Anaeromyxobacter sp.]
MSLNATEIEAVVAELAPLAGARVDAVRAPSERAVALDLFGREGPARIFLSAEADLTRVHAAAERPTRGGPPGRFEQLLRAELGGARLAAIETLPGDRVVALRFEAPRGEARLVAELTGRHGNLFLVGADGVIRASAGRNLSERRKLVAGAPYVPPAPPPEPGAPVVRFAPVPAERFPLSAAIERAYAAREAERRLAEARRRLREPIRAGLARAARALVRLADEAARVPAAEADRRTADLLKANLRRVKRGMREVAVTEWTEEGPREVVLALDPALAPRANLERYYRRYRRIVESAERVAERTAEVRAREAALRALLPRIEAAAEDELPRLEKEARRLGAGPRRAPAAPAAPARHRRREEPALPYRTFHALDGTAILVGRGAAENDTLTRAVARGNDLWLHARGVTGAHVVVRLDRGKAPGQETLIDAAHLAVHFSDARGAPQADVAYTRAKHVRKPRGAAPGAVVYSQEKVILLRVEPARIERLLADEDGET